MVQHHDSLLGSAEQVWNRSNPKRGCWTLFARSCSLRPVPLCPSLGPHISPGITEAASALWALQSEKEAGRVSAGAQQHSFTSSRRAVPLHPEWISFWGRWRDALQPPTGWWQSASLSSSTASIARKHTEHKVLLPAAKQCRGLVLKASQKLSIPLSSYKPTSSLFQRLQLWVPFRLRHQRMPADRQGLCLTVCWFWRAQETCLPHISHCQAKRGGPHKAFKQKYNLCAQKTPMMGGAVVRTARRHTEGSLKNAPRGTDLARQSGHSDLRTTLKPSDKLPASVAFNTD